MRIFFIFFFFISTLFATEIGKINSFSNDLLQFSSDIYNGPITRYNDRIIANNFIKTEEYLIKSNGELEFISFYDYSSPHSASNGNLLVLPDFHRRGLHILDISVTPMELKAFVNLSDKVYGNLLYGWIFFH